MRIGLLVIVGLTWLATPATAQFPQTGRALERPEHSVERARQWIEAIVSHTPGQSDAATALVGSWTFEQTQNLPIELYAIRRLILDPNEKITYVTVDTREVRYTMKERLLLDEAAAIARRAGLSDTDLVARAIVLHTDIAWLDNKSGFTQHHADGQPLEQDTQVDHWNMARTLADRLRPRDGRDADLAFWYRATLASMAGIQMWNPGHTARALERFQDDADLQFLAGCLHEMLASPGVQAVMSLTSLPFGTTLHVGSTKSEVGNAVSMYRRALAVHPGHVEARLRYGRVLLLSGRASDAISELRRVASADTEPEQRYYAQMFLGAALEATHERGPARTAYQAAAALFPTAQAPRLALSQLAYDEDRSGALDALEPLLAAGAEDSREDPWWTYLPSCGRDGDRLLTEARERLATPARATAGRPDTHGGR